MGETWVRSLGWEDPLEKGAGTHSSIVAWRAWQAIVHGIPKSWTQLSDFHFTLLYVTAPIGAPVSWLSSFLIKICMFGPGGLVSLSCSPYGFL